MLYNYECGAVQLPLLIIYIISSASVRQMEQGVTYRSLISSPNQKKIKI